MLKKISDKHFWLKLVILGLGTILVIAGLMQATLLWMFDSQVITNYIHSRLSPTHRQIDFDTKISRHWFPSPGFTLHNVDISEPNQNKSAIEIEYIKFHFAWTSFLESSPSLTAMTLEKPSLKLIQNHQKWNVSDIISIFQEKKNSRLETFSLNQANIEMQDSDNHINLQFKSLSALFNDLQTQTPTFSASSQVSTADLPEVMLSSQGLLNHQQELWQISNWKNTFTANIPNVGPSTLEMTAQADIDVGLLSFQLNHLNLSLNSQESDDLSVTLQAESAFWENNTLLLPAASGNGIYKQKNRLFSTTFSFKDANWSNDTFHVEEAKARSSLQTDQSNTLVISKADLDLHLNGTYQLTNLALETRQNFGEDFQRTRLVSNLQGNSEGKLGGSWMFSLSGQLDDANTNLDLQYHQQENPILNVRTNIEKFDLSPYLPKMVVDSDDIALNQKNLQLLNYLNDLTVTGNLQIDTFKALNWTFQNFSTDFKADKKGFLWNNLRADLYGGKVFGTLSAENTMPPKFAIEQTFQNVNIQHWLQAFGHYANIEGQGNAYLQGSATGNDWDNLRSSLTGQARFNVKDGRLRGIDFNQLLKNAQTMPKKGIEIKDLNADKSTDFNAFNSQMKITDGVTEQHSFQLISNQLDVIGGGQFQFESNQLNYRLHLTDRHNYLINLPMRITGSVTNPIITLDYNALTNGLYNPEQKQNAVKNAIFQQWQLIQSLPAIQAE